MVTKEMVDEFCKHLIDEGKIVEAGWLGFKIMVLEPVDLSENQVEDMKMAFFGGAYHLFTSMTRMLDPGKEPSDNDIKRIDQINTELEAFVGVFEEELRKRQQKPPISEDPAPTLGDAPIEQEYRSKMQAVAMTLDKFFNGELEGNDRHTGFVLLVFPFEEREGRCNFISNGADREDVVTLFKEMIQKFSGQPDIVGHA
jgi:hypothetical protein